MKPLRVGIMGAGRIAQGFDHPGSPEILSMAHAVTRSTEFALAGFFDTDVTRAEAAERKWGCSATPRKRGDWLGSGFDVIYIATPSASHSADVSDAIRSARIVIAEKPLATEGALGLLEHARVRGVLLFVNFPRRVHSLVRRTEAWIGNGHFGELEAVTISVSRGLMHNASHLFDLIVHWFPGEWDVCSAGIVRGGAALFQIRSARRIVDVHIQSFSWSNYLFEMQLFSEKGKIELHGSPETLSVCQYDASARYPEFRVLREVFGGSLEDEPLLSGVLRHVFSCASDPALYEKHRILEVISERLQNAVRTVFETGEI